jgi:prepilin-type N-terminal cleavage/methylation domain-containing protein
VRQALRRRLSGAVPGAGFTLIELLVATTMGVVLATATGSLLISAVRDEPGISQKSVNIQTVRWALERITRELRNGVEVDKATAASVSFQTYVRHTTCGGSTVLPSSSPSIKCEVTFSCSGTICTRLESAPGEYTGTPTTIFSGISNASSVFTYSPNSTSATYVGVTLTIPNPTGSGSLTASDGATLRNATLND